jgi:acylphosphatase
VFFRDTCRHLARREGVAGWVRNAPDGTVEAAFEGVPEAVDRMVRWMRLGPPDARVNELQVFDEAPRGETRFTVRG